MLKNVLCKNMPPVIPWLLIELRKKDRFKKLSEYDEIINKLDEK